MANNPPAIVQPGMNIYWQDPAGLQLDKIRAAIALAQKLYGPIHLNAQPLPNGQPLTEPYYNLIFANHPVVKQPGLDKGGEAIFPAHSAYVYPNQLQNSIPDALGVVVAHELGHLLGLQHVLAGVMNPKIERNSEEPLDKGQLKKAEKALRLRMRRQRKGHGEN